MVVLKRSPKWWIGMAAVGGLLVGAEVALVSVSSPHNPPITNNFLNRSKRVRTKKPISNKIVKMAMLHKETSKMVAHRMVPTDGGPQGGGPQVVP